MQFKYILLLIYISLIKQALTTTVHDLNKYGKLEDFNSSIVIFDSHDFKLDEEIYIIITGYFQFEYIHYIFIDSLEDLYDIDITNITNIELNENLIKEYSNKADTVNDEGLKKRYYTIEKTKSHLNGKEGKYLALYVYMDGTYDIENTKENQGNSKVVIACVVVGVVVVIAIIGIICYCRKRKQQQQNNGDFTVQQNVNVQNNNGPYNNRNNYNNNTPYNNQNAYDNGINSGNNFNNNGNYYNNGYNQNY